MVNAEVLQLHIAIHFGVGVVADRKVTAVDVRAAERVAVAVFGIEICLEQLLLSPGAELAEDDPGGFVNAPPKPSIVWKRFSGSTTTLTEPAEAFGAGLRLSSWVSRVPRCWAVENTFTGPDRSGSRPPGS